MTPEIVVDLLREAMYLIILMVSMLIVPGLLVGLAVSVFQAATQINEQTLSFFPRLLATFVAILVGGPYIAMEVQQFTQRLFDSIPILLS
jgi:flagellar biosynthetic protein FliQ